MPSSSSLTMSSGARSCVRGLSGWLRRGLRSAPPIARFREEDYRRNRVRQIKFVRDYRCIPAMIVSGRRCSLCYLDSGKKLMRSLFTHRLNIIIFIGNKKISSHSVYVCAYKIDTRHSEPNILAHPFSTPSCALLDLFVRRST